MTQHDAREDGRKLLSAYEEVVPISHVPDRKLGHIIGLLLDHLKLEIVREQTPDYSEYELRPSPQGPSK